jgi:predicted DNA-binding ribbon-helix-helix protein
VEKDSIVISGHATSFSLEPEFWVVLKQLAMQRNLSVPSLISQIDSKRVGGLSSAVRVFILKALEENIQNYNTKNNSIGSKNSK